MQNLKITQYDTYSIFDGNYKASTEFNLWIANIDKQIEHKILFDQLNTLDLFKGPILLEYQINDYYKYFIIQPIDIDLSSEFCLFTTLLYSMHEQNMQQVNRKTSFITKLLAQICRVAPKNIVKTQTNNKRYALYNKAQFNLPDCYKEDNFFFITIYSEISKEQKTIQDFIPKLTGSSINYQMIKPFNEDTIKKYITNKTKIKIKEPVKSIAMVFLKEDPLTSSLPFKDIPILAVSRKYDLTQFGLPGGKLDQNETTHQAAKRETFEEVGYWPKTFQHILTEPDHNKKYNFNCTAFLSSFSKEDLLTIKDSYINNENCIVKWTNWTEIFNGPFGLYNKNVFNKLEKKFSK